MSPGGSGLPQQVQKRADELAGAVSPRSDCVLAAGSRLAGSRHGALRVRCGGVCSGRVVDVHVGLIGSRLPPEIEG